MAVNSFVFDEQFYLTQNPDVAAAVSAGGFASGQAHFNAFGRFEGRDPNAYFDTSFYLGTYPDVAAANVNPFTHFQANGASEGRLFNANIEGTVDTDGDDVADEFDSAAYLAANTDVAAAIPGQFASAYQHYVLFGQFEGRPGAQLTDGTALSGPFQTGSTGGGNVGQTFTLTANVDGPGASAPATNTDGTNAADTYIGTFASANGDFINGKGGNDALKLVGAGASTVALTAVERVEGNAQGGVASINVAGSTGIQTLASVGSSNDLTFSGLAALVDTVEVKDVTAGDVTVTYNASAVAGTADAQKIALNSSTAGTVNVNGVETFAVNSTGTNTLTGLTGSAVKNVTVDGAGSLGVATDLANTITSFDASAATGNVRAGFAAGADVTVKTGAGDDRIDMNGGLTSKDTVALGDGTDTLVVSDTDVSAAADEGLKGINAATGVEILEFDGTSSAVDDATLTNAGITKVVLNTAGLDTVTNASAMNFAFGTTNGGAATFTTAGSNTTLNLALEGASKTATTAINDADVGALTATGALTVNLNSTGTTDAAVNFNAVVATDFNNVGTVTAAANTTVNLTGDANTQIAGFTNAVNLQAGSLTGALIADGSTGADILVGGSGKNWIEGLGGVDNIDISKSSTVGGDQIDLRTIVATADRDIVTGFQAGASGDQVLVAAANTTATTAAGATIAIQEVNTNAGTVNFLTGTNDLLELNFNIAGNTLAGSADGTALLAAVGTVNVATDGDDGFLVAYQNGNAFVYQVSEGGDADAAVAAGDIALIGQFNDVAVGAFDASNFQLV